jgi:type IV pilus assembly protein PilA
MLKSLLQRAREARAAELGDGEGLEEGFTLIELMVVLLIIAILLAIAIPTFLGVTSSASDRASQSNLTNALTEAKAIFQNSSSYGTNAAALTAFQASAPEFTWGTGACTTNSNCISEQVVDVSAAGDGEGLTLATWSSKDSTCWYALDLEATPASQAAETSPLIAYWTPANPAAAPATTAGVFYAKLVNSSANCSGNYAATHANFTWGTSYANAPVG